MVTEKLRIRALIIQMLLFLLLHLPRRTLPSSVTSIPPLREREIDSRTWCLLDGQKVVHVTDNPALTGTMILKGPQMDAF